PSRQIVQGRYRPICRHLPAFVSETGQKRVSQFLRSPLYNGPSDAMGQNRQDKTKGGCQGFVEGKHCVSGHACEKGPRMIITECCFSKVSRRPHGFHTEAGRQKRM